MTSYVGKQYNIGSTATVRQQSMYVNRTKAKTNNKSRAAIIMVTALLVLVLFTIVSCNSYINKLQQENNRLRSNISSLEADIDSIKSQIVEETKVTRIEKIASEKYGMVYPNSENCITISSNDETGTKLAEAIREQAYY